MAKIKVHELAKELEISSKEVLAYLQVAGVEAKAAQSSIEDAQAEKVRGHFGKVQAPKAEAPKAEAPKAEAPKAEVPKAEAPKVDAPKADAPRVDAPRADATQKKKKIIFVSNPQNSKMSGGRLQGAGTTGSRPQGGMQQGARPQGGPGGRPQGGMNRPGQGAPRTPIKPLTPPSPTPSVQMVPNRPKPVVKPAPAPVKEENRQNVPQNVPQSAAPAPTPAVAPAAAPATTPAPAPQTPAAQVSPAPSTKSASVQSERLERGEKPDRGPKPSYGDRPERGDRQDRGSRPSFGDRPERGERQDRGPRPSSGDRPERGDRQDRGPRPSYGDRPERGDRQDRGPRQERGGYNQAQGGRYGERPAYGGDKDGRDGGRGSYQGRPQGTGRRPEGASRPGGMGDQGAFRDGGSHAGGGRSYGNSDRDQRGNGAQGDKFKRQGAGKGFAAETAGKDVEKHREEEKRRFSQEKDNKRTKKDFIYEEEDNVKAKPGRFIKPEKKKEEVQEEAIKVIVLPETITIKDLADKMKLQPAAIVKKLFLEGKIVTVNQEISYEEAENIAMEYEILCEKEVKVDVIEELLKEDEEAEDELTARPPVICVMGHVDHGKTSLLDAIRKTNVTDKEAGGITQHIGAYTVNVQDRKITFLDTPGHEAFTAMRMRGANSTDIAILVVAADDGVMPQTVEAISHAKAAGIEIVVAINKIDKPSANIERVKQELTEYELVPVDWGGATEFVPVSAKSGEGIEDLLETILLTAEILELKANPNRHGRGLVIEAQLDKGRGPVATVLVQKGTLHVGDFISAGACHGKVRAMIDDKGRRVKEAPPSTPVEILGLSDVPSAGEVFIAHETDKIAKSYAETYLAQNKEKMLEETRTRMSLDDLFSQIQEGNLKELNLIVKADVQGSVEAVKQSLLKLSNEEVVVKCIHGGVGAISESDVVLASASNAIIIGFNVHPDVTAKATAEREGVDVRLYKVIYQAIEDIEAAMKGMLDPVYEEKVIGHAEVRQIFKASAVGNIAGSYVLDGIFQRNCKIRITREGKQIYEGELASLKRFKDDVKEVKAGFECGLVFDGFDQMQELDIVEAYIMVEVPR